jgi:checkpoint serine/threonine-protein kinase
MYTRYVERREEIWSFLEARDIGTRHAIFYEEWAAAAEGLGRKKAADNIYRLGINRNAAPLERLQTRHKAFLQRTLAAGAAAFPEDEDLPVRTPARSILGTVSTSAPVRSAQQAPRSVKNNGAKLAIFSDDQAGPSGTSDPSEWADIGTRDDRRKENTVEPVPWKGETLPQSAARSKVAPRTPKVEVFKDAVNSGLR